MITVISKPAERSEGIQSTIQHHIKKENIGLIFNILRKQLYSSPILASIREPYFNAKDSHVEMGKPELPVKITLPTMLDSHYKVRDYGCGLSEKEIENLYASYGGSDKRKSDDYVGGFGIGAAAPLSYCDSFIIDSYQNGVVTSYNSFIDESNVGKIVKMGSSLSNEPTGLQVTVPVKTNDIRAWHDEAIKLFAWAKILPDLINLTDEDKQKLSSLRDTQPILEGENYKYFGNRQSKVVMGEIPYTINSSAFNSDEVSEEASMLLSEGIILFGKVSDYEINANRETLSYSTSTKRKLIQVLNSISKDFIKKGNDTFVNCKSLWEAKCLYQKTFTHDGSLYHFRRFMQNRLTWNGKSISDTHFLKSNQTDGAKCTAYSEGWTHKQRERISGAPDQIIEANAKYLVVENDLNLENHKEIVGHLLGLLKIPLAQSASNIPAPYKKVYLMTFQDAAAKAAWLKESEYDGPMTLISSYPKEKMNLYYQSDAVLYPKNAKHQTREFTLNLNYTRHGSSHYRRGHYIEYFDTCDVDVDNDSGIYVMIDSFVCQNQTDRYYNTAPNQLIFQLNQVKNLCGITIPTIYAFKAKHADKVKANKNMVNVWEWMKGHVVSYFGDMKEQTKIANWEAIQLAKRECYGLDYFDKLKNFKTDPKNALGQFLMKINILFKKDGMASTEVEQKKNLAQSFGIDMKQWKSTIDIKTDFKTVNAKYPLLFNIIGHIGFNTNEVKKTLGHLEDYVSMIDERDTVNQIMASQTASNGVV